MLESFNKWSTDSLRYWIYLQRRLEYRCIYSRDKSTIKYKLFIIKIKSGIGICQ